MQRNRPRQRSVAIQSTEVPDSEEDYGFISVKLCKKAAFRNLLHKSVTVSPQENNKRSEIITLTNGKITRGVQTNQNGLQEHYLDGEPVAEYSGLRGSGSEMVKIIEKPTGNPGSSRITSTIMVSPSRYSEMNELHRRTKEGSLAVIYSNDSKALHGSRSSNLLFFGSQGSRRFSDETVILIEDYQSYDFLNAARRQQEGDGDQEKGTTCCGRKRKVPVKVLARPVNLDRITEENQDDAVVCRICHEGENVEPFIQPCLCKGSIGCVHATCLKIWLEQSNTNRCELCDYPYAIRQTRKYSKWVSVMVFFKSVVDRRAFAYDVISFVVITPLTLVGVAMCIQASVLSGGASIDATNLQMGNITRAGMIMLSITIFVAYVVWMYTLISYHYKGWKKWYSTSYDVDVLPVRMTSEERVEAARRLQEEVSRRQLSREHGSALATVFHSPQSRSVTYHQRRHSVAPITRTSVVQVHR